MSEIRDLIERLVNAGVDPIDAAEMVTQAIAFGMSNAPGKRSAAAIRQERYRRNKASQVTVSDATKEFSPAPLSENPPQKEKTPKGVKKKNGSRLPEDFKPDIEWAISRGLSRQDAEGQAERFANYWRAKPGAAGVKLDWDATWRNWVLSHAERVGVSAPQQVDERDKWPKRLVYARKHAAWSSKDWGAMPGQPGCRAPPELLLSSDGQGWTEFAGA